jgi:hypothetical protein
MGRPRRLARSVLRDEDGIVSDDHFAHIVITGALALAGAHLVRHWVNPRTVPELASSDGAMKLRIDRRGTGLQDLRKTVEQVRASAECLAESCNAWLVEIDKLLENQSSSGSQDGANTDSRNRSM